MILYRDGEREERERERGEGKEVFVMFVVLSFFFSFFRLFAPCAGKVGRQNLDANIILGFSDS